MRLILAKGYSKQNIAIAIKNGKTLIDDKCFGRVNGNEFFKRKKP